MSASEAPKLYLQPVRVYGKGTPTYIWGRGNKEKKMG